MLKKGDRVRLTYMPEDPDPIAPGTTGTVEFVERVDLGGGRDGRFTQVGVKWDNGRTLMMTIPPDDYEVIG